MPIIESFKDAQREFLVQGKHDEVKSTIEKFKQLNNAHKISGNEKDINYWRKQGFDSFKQFVEQQSSRPSKTQVKRQNVAGKSINLKETDDWLIVIPLDKNASCFHGKHTDWCTAKPDQDHYEEYFTRGVTLIYAINKKNGEKYAIAASDANIEGDKAEFFDKDDNSMYEHEYESATGLDSKELINLAKTYNKEIEGGRTALKANSPSTAFHYANEVLNGRFPEGEAAIATSVEYSYEYALDVLRGRFPEGEAIIATNGEYAYRYALKILKKRFPQGEPAIAKSAMASYHYAIHVVRGRFPEGEAAIGEDNNYAEDYAVKVIKGRFPEGEAAISEYSSSSYHYAKDILKGRFPQGEAAIAQSPSYALKYAMNVINGRFPEAEIYINRTPGYKEEYADFLKTLK